MNHDETPGLPQSAPSVSVDWYKRFPNGGTAYLKPRSQPNTVNDVSSRFREAPNGGGTARRLTGSESGDAGNPFPPKK